MNKRQWTGLLMIYVGYLSLGATVFFYIESPEELRGRADKFIEYRDLIKEIEDRCPGNRSKLFERLSEYFGQDLRPNMETGDVVPRIWDYYNSFFFVVTVVSTIGYGNLHPTTDFGRIVMILYAIIGIPLNGILLTSLGQFFGAVFLRAHKRYKNHSRFEGRVNLVINILTYLIPGMIFFIFLPAGIFTYFEGWDYTMSVYYAFVSLTTIGFGDLVAGQQLDTTHSETAVLLYRVMLIFWIIFGLGYLIMLLGFVAQAMNSRKIVEMEQKLMSSLTHSRLWHGFAKDIGYLRRHLNEVYLDKLKPVFREDVIEPPHALPRSKSLPQLFTPSLQEAAKLRRRQRAMSEHVPSGGLVRMLSESDLQRIDKNATFAAAAAVPSTAELMRKVIDAYGGGQWPSTEDDEDDDGGGLKGIDGFSDEDVLASERGYDQQTTVSAKSRHPSSLFYVPSYEDTVSRQPHRGRAMSECPPPELKKVTSCSNPSGPVDWTWSGPAANKLHDIIKQRNKQKLMMGLNKERKPSLTQSVIAGAKRLNPLRNRKRNDTESEDITKSRSDIKNSKPNLAVPIVVAKRRSLQENRLSADSPPDHHYMTHTAVAGGINTAEDDLLRLYSRGGRLFDEENTKDLLEETSLGDFLRVLTNIHSRVGERIVTADIQQQPARPRRKLGTASLTPPRIRSLLDLFEPPMPPSSPKIPKKRKPSKMFRNDIKKDMSASQSPGVDIGDKQPSDDSHIKRLGRFLLRSYSIVSKDVDEPGTSKQPSRKKRFSLWPSESEDVRDVPQFQVQIDSPEEGSTQSLDIIIPIDDLMRPPPSQRPSIPHLSGILSNPNAGSNTDVPRTPAPKRKTSFLS